MITQVNPYVLTGISNELPNPSRLADGTIFYAKDIQAAVILVIDELTGERLWEPLGNSDAGPLVPIPPAPPVIALLKWSGGGNPFSGPISIADDPGVASVEFGGVSPNYPLAVDAVAISFAVNLLQNDSGSPTINVYLTVNDAFVVTLNISSLGPSVTPINVPMAAGSIINVKIGSMGGNGIVLISAMIALV